MNRLLLLSFGLSLCACTTVKENGRVVFSTCADLRGVHFRSANGTVLDADTIASSPVHRAIGAGVATGAAAVGSAIVTAGLVP